MQKPRLSFWQIWNMSFGFLGIQFGFALQNANVSRIFETLGASIDNIPILWIAAPVTGLIIQPIIGHMSDKTWNRLGRRRPYFLVGAILASIAIIFMPNSPALWVAAGMLWIMDASINISMEPFRAFVGDMLPSEQRTAGFAMQSFFIGTGAVIASALPYMMTNWFGISNVGPEGEIPASVKFSFYVGALVFFLAVAWTVFSTKEYSPEELKRFSEAEESQMSKIKSQKSELVTASRFFKDGSIWLLLGILITIIITLSVKEIDYGLYVLFVGGAAFGILQIVAGLLTKNDKTKNGFVIVLNDLYKMPKTMKQLALVQFFSWFALFAMWIYSTPAVTPH
ncbi:MAG: MFS transporter, partial [Ignavibacteriaceae bacterium]|nr:MFS transporter [Ignavibacteriaceae bacterium]